MKSYKTVLSRGTHTCMNTHKYINVYPIARFGVGRVFLHLNILCIYICTHVHKYIGASIALWIIDIGRWFKYDCINNKIL
jgi:hypothetical protein